MAITQEVVVLNDFGNMRVEERQRTTSEGTTSRYTMTLTAEPIIHDFAALKLNPAVAKAIGELIKKQIGDIKEKASEATIEKRARAAEAYARGKPWALKRYAGGRTGGMPPESASYDRLFNDSGRLAQSIAVMQNPKEEGFTINVAANRLHPETFTGDQFTRMITKLRELVPALRGGVEVLQDPTVREAIKDAQAEWIVVAYRSGDGGARAEALKMAAKLGWQHLLRPILIGA